MDVSTLLSPYQGKRYAIIPRIDLEQVAKTCKVTVSQLEEVLTAANATRVDADTWYIRL